jgi:hypothetical protein
MEVPMSSSNISDEPVTPAYQLQKTDEALGPSYQIQKPAKGPVEKEAGPEINSQESRAQQAGGAVLASLSASSQGAQAISAPVSSKSSEVVGPGSYVKEKAAGSEVSAFSQAASQHVPATEHQEGRHTISDYKRRLVAPPLQQEVPQQFAQQRGLQQIAQKGVPPLSPQVIEEACEFFETIQIPDECVVPNSAIALITDRKTPGRDFFKHPNLKNQGFLVWPSSSTPGSYAIWLSGEPDVVYKIADKKMFTEMIDYWCGNTKTPPEWYIAFSKRYKLLSES